MSWVKLDDQFFRHPKARRAGKDGRALYVTALAYCSANLTDGHVHTEALPLVAAEAEVKPAVAEVLVKAGLWEKVEDGYVVHDYLEYQPSAEKAKAEREAARERMRGRRGTRPPPPSGRSSAEVQTNSNGSSPTPSHPVPDVPSGTSPPNPPSTALALVPNGSAAPTDGFEDFWQTYPKRNGKRLGRSPTEARWAKLSRAEREAAHVGAANLAQAVEQGLTLPKDPERFLRHRVWEDWQEPAEPTRVNGRPSTVERSWRNIMDGPTEGIR